MRVRHVDRLGEGCVPWGARVHVLLGIMLMAGLTGCGVMQSMMTRSVDESAHAKVTALHGAHAVRRLGADGNSFALKLEAGADLRTADLVLGSDDEANVLWVALDAQNHARFEEADFVLRSPLGEESDEFSATVELGRVLLSITDGSDRSFELVDTNKNRIFIEDGQAELYVGVDDDHLDLFVRSGAVRLSNERSNLTITVAAGQGKRIDAQGAATDLTADAEPIRAIDWQITRPGPQGNAP